MLIGTSQVLKGTDNSQNIVANGALRSKRGNTTSTKSKFGVRGHSPPFGAPATYLGRGSRRLARRSLMTVPDNLNVNSIGYHRRKFQSLDRIIAKFLRSKKYPLRDYSFRGEVRDAVQGLQRDLASLCAMDKSDLALRYCQVFCFSLVIRVYTVDGLRTRSSAATPGTDEEIIKSGNDYATCLRLIEETHPKNISLEQNMQVRSVETPQKEPGKFRNLGVGNVIDRVLQCQFLVLLDPILDSYLPEHFYGYRKGRNAHQALGFLSTSIQRSDLSRYHLVSADLSQCFDSISNEYILANFPFPEKFKGLLERWLKGRRLYESGNKERFWRGGAQGSTIGPAVWNFVSSQLTASFFEDKNFINPRLVNRRGKRRKIEVTRFLIGYAEHFILKVCNRHEAEYVQHKLKACFSKAGLSINTEKTVLLDLSQKSRFEWLGYTYLVVPKREVRSTHLISTGQRFLRQKKGVNQSLLINYITDRNFSKIKTELKAVVKKLKHLPLDPVVFEINAVLRGVALFYSFGNNSARLDYLRHYVDRLFWRTLVEKYRYKGVRRPRWVAKTFFLTKAYPVGLT